MICPRTDANLVVSVMSAVCTPVGLSRMFTVMGQLLVKPAVSDRAALVGLLFLNVCVVFGVFLARWNFKRKYSLNKLSAHSSTTGGPLTLTTEDHKYVTN